MEEIKTWFWKWEYAVTLRPMTDEERQEWLQLGGGEDELDRNWPKVTASPLEDRYPWDELEATGRVVLHHVADTLALMREELGVSP